MNKNLKKNENNTNNICIYKEFKEDNGIVAIKRYVYKMFSDEINGKIKNNKLILNEFISIEVENINKDKNIQLFYKKWKFIIPYTSKDNRSKIKRIYNDKENEKDAYELLEMTFKRYYYNFLGNNLKKFLEEEKTKQEADFKQRKYKIIITELKKDEKYTFALQTISQFTLFRVLNKDGKKQSDNEIKKGGSSKSKDHSLYSYTIIEVEKFENFVKEIYDKSLNFELTKNERVNINNNLDLLKDLAFKFRFWFQIKKSRKREKVENKNLHY